MMPPDMEECEGIFDMLQGHSKGMLERSWIYTRSHVLENKALVSYDYIYRAKYT